MTRWFLHPAPRPDALVQLVCLPYAGAGATAFHRWPAAIGPDVEVLPVALPGREARIMENPALDPAELAAAIAERVDRPWALYGHSLGARLGFEAIRALRRTGGPMPLRLYVGASRAPRVHADGYFDGLSRLDDEELVARLAAGGGAPAEVLAHTELLELLLPVLRADFTWLDDYVYRPDEPLPVPVVGFAGTGDRAVPVEQFAGWAGETAAGFTRHDVDGGHFFLHDRLPELLALLTADLRVALSEGARP